MRMRIWASSSWRLRSDQRKKQKGSATGTAQDRIATTETGRRPILLMIVEDPSGNVSGLEVTAGNRQRDAISGGMDRARQIGTAQRRERVGQSLEISDVAGAVKKHIQR